MAFIHLLTIKGEEKYSESHSTVGPKQRGCLRRNKTGRIKDTSIIQAFQVEVWPEFVKLKGEFWKEMQDKMTEKNTVIFDCYSLKYEKF